MEDEFSEDITIDNSNGDELLNKIKTMENELREKTRLYLEQKHQYEDLYIEVNNLKEKNKNQEKLLKFYEEKVSKNYSIEKENNQKQKNKIKKLEEKIVNLNTKIKGMEGLMIKKNNELVILKQDLKQEKEISNKSLDLINEKDEEIKDLKEKYEDNRYTIIKKEHEIKKDLNLAVSDKNEIKELKNELYSQQKQIELFKKNSEEKIIAYANDNYRLCNEIKELKDIVFERELENKKLKEKNDIFEIEKIIEINYFKENNFTEINILKHKKENHEKIEENNENENVKLIIDEYIAKINDLIKRNKYLEKELTYIKLNNRGNETNNANNAETDSKINLDNIYSLNNDNELKDLKNKLIQKDEEIKKVIEEKDKTINELTNKYNNENNNYTKKITDLESRLKFTTNELNELKTKNDEANIEEKFDDVPTPSLEEQLDESKRIIEELREEIKYYENEIEELKKYIEKANKADELEAKNNYLNNTIEILKKNIEELKNQNQKVKEELKEEIIKIQNDLGETKYQLATTVYEREDKYIRYRKYIVKLKDKLISLGYKFKEKRGNK